MKRSTFKRVLEYALVICIILEFNTVYMVFPVVARVVQILPAIFLLCLLALSYQSLSKKMGIIITAYFIWSIFPFFTLSNDAYLGYVKSFVVILPLLMIYLSKKTKSCSLSDSLSLLLRYSNVMICLAVVSVVMWILCSLLKIIPASSVFPNTWTGTLMFIPSYFNIYFETQSVTLLSDRVIRNSGIFNEAPMYNMAVCIALAIDYFLRPNPSKARISVLVITVLTTLTTTGQLFLLGLLGYHVFRKISRRYRVLMIISIPLLFFTAYTIGNMLIETKKESGDGGGSVESRSEDIRYCIEAGMKYPVFGVGIVQKDEQHLWRGVQLGRSNSLFAVFARGGIYFLTLYIGTLLLVPLLYYRKNKDSKRLLIMLFFFVLFTFTICFTNYITLLFMAYGLSQADMRKKPVLCNRCKKHVVPVA